jgi:hypothetical protein
MAAPLTKMNPASTMIVEDHLKKCLAKTSNKPYQPNKNKLLPRTQHSPFGDFPKESMPKRVAKVTEVEPIQRHEQSIAA